MIHEAALKRFQSAGEDVQKVYFDDEQPIGEEHIDDGEYLIDDGEDVHIIEE